MRMPYVMSWSGGVQWEFSNNWVFELQYQGQSGVGEINNWDINAIPLNISSDRATLDQIFQSAQNFKPYRQFGSINLYSNFGHNTYHGATWRVEKRMAGGLSLNAFHTWSKTLNESEADGNANGATYYNRRLEKARSTTDIRHRFVSVVDYELPFGKGRRFMNRSGVLNHVLGGWELTWVQTLQSGQPFTVTYAGSPNRYLPTGSARPNILTTVEQAQVSDWTLGPHRYPNTAQNPYLKFDSFAYPAAYTLGNLGRNTFEGPGLLWTQLSLSKSWQIGERARVQVRLDGNNFPFMQPNFSNPSAAYNANSAAQFGRGFGTRGSFSDVGTANGHMLLVMRFQF